MPAADEKRMQSPWIPYGHHRVVSQHDRGHILANKEVSDLDECEEMCDNYPAEACKNLQMCDVDGSTKMRCKLFSNPLDRNTPTIPDERCTQYYKKLPGQLPKN